MAVAHTNNNVDNTMQLPFADTVDNYFFTTNPHEHILVNSDLSYQPYRYTDYNKGGDIFHDLDPVNNHFNNIFPNCKYDSADNFKSSFELMP